MMDRKFHYSAEEMREAISVELAAVIPDMFGSANSISEYFCAMNKAKGVIREGIKESGQLLNIVAGYDNGTYIKLGIRSNGGRQVVEVESKWSRDSGKPNARVSWMGSGGELSKLKFELIGEDVLCEVRENRVAIANGKGVKPIVIDIVGSGVLGLGRNQEWADVWQSQQGKANSIHSVVFDDKNVGIGITSMDNRSSSGNQFCLVVPRILQIPVPVNFAPNQQILAQRDAKMEA